MSEYIDYFEKIHGLITLAFDIKEGKTANSASKNDLKSKLIRIDKLLQLPQNKEKLSHVLRPTVLKNLLLSVDKAIALTKRFENQGLFSQLINFDTNAKDFQAINISLDSALTDLTFYIHSESISVFYRAVSNGIINPPEITHDESMQVFSENPTTKIIIWLDPNPKHNKQNIRKCFSKDTTLYFIQCVCWAEVKIILDDPRVNPIVSTLEGFFRIRIVTNTFHPLEKGEKPNPNCVDYLLNQLNNTYNQVPVLVYGFDKKYVRNAQNLIKALDYPYAIATDKEKACLNYCQLSTVLIVSIGDFEEDVKDQILKVQAAGYCVGCTTEFLVFQEYIKRAKGIPTVSAHQFSIIVLVNEGETGSFLRPIVNLIKELKFTPAWRSSRVLFYRPKTSIHLLDDICLYQGIDYTATLDMVSWLDTRPPTPEINQIKVTIVSIQGRNLKPANNDGTSDPYVILKINNKEFGRTTTIMRNLNPDWLNINKETVISSETDEIKFILMDYNSFFSLRSDIYIGGCSVRFASDYANKYKEGRNFSDEFALFDVLGDGTTGIRGTLKIVFNWTLKET
eukprot:TRINITY_DN1072_c0_g1_i1.p1 TRINITY_DN1072_c0_g1~~TRINITY_DN1072_c0_g1_i1.p1  ORF type:complete len:566 (+),score=90.22 TRINITY_DN1072_c0_g1_i1:1314-3011(+)